MSEYPELPPVLNVPELGEFLKIGRNQAYALAKSDRINSIKIGKQIRVPREAVLRFLAGENS